MTGRARWLAFVVASASACGFGEYHTKSSGTGGSTGSTSSEASTTASSSSVSSSSGMGGAPECGPPKGLTEEDCWTAADETTATNAACLAAPAVTGFADTASDRLRIQRLRAVEGKAFAVGSVNQGINLANRSHALFRRIDGGIDYLTDPIIANTSDSDLHFIEATDFAGRVETTPPNPKGYLAGFGRGPTDQLGLESTTARRAFLEAAIHMNPQNAAEPDMGGTGESRMLAVTSSATGDAYVALALLNDTSGMCDGTDGVFALSIAWMGTSLHACVKLGTPCKGFADDDLVPYDLLVHDGISYAVGQICDGPGVKQPDDRTGIIAPITSGPSLGTVRSIQPDHDGVSAADIVGVRAAGERLVVAGTFIGRVTFGDGGKKLLSAGGTDAFVAVLDPTGLVFEQVVAFGGAGEDLVTDLDVEPRPNHPNEFGVYLVGHVTGPAAWGCVPSTEKPFERAFVAKALLTTDDRTDPELLYFAPIGTAGDSRAERVVIADGKLYVSGRLGPQATLFTGADQFPSNPMTDPRSFVLVSPLEEKVTPP